MVSRVGVARLISSWLDLHGLYTAWIIDRRLDKIF